MTNSFAALSSLKSKAVALGLALCLTCASFGFALSTPSAALANEYTASPSTAAETAADHGSAASLLKLGSPALPLASKGTSSTSCVGDGDYSMTFYYIELVHYHDPELNHPSGARLLHQHTVTGLNLGDQLDTWDYVADIEGYLFFDAIPARPIVVEDEALNGVELRYMNPEMNEYTVDYYRVCDGSDHSDAGTPDAPEGSEEDAHGERFTEIFDGQPVVFEKIKSVTVDEQPFNVKVHGDDLAHHIDDLMYLESYPSSIRVSTDPEDNVINLLYADSMASLPDDTEVPETPEEGSGPDNTPGNGGEDSSNPDNGNTPDNGDGDTPGNGDGSESTPDDGDTPGNGNGPIDIPGSGADINGTPDTDDPSEDDAGENTPGTDNDDQPDTTPTPGVDDTTNPDGGTADDEDDSADDSSDADGNEDTTVETADGKPAADATLPQTGDPLSGPAALAAASAILAAGALVVARRQS